jgi:hypothetical protein
MFDPELCKDNNNKSNADKIAMLPNLPQNTSIQI